ncbi:MAG: Fur family transcriptional regulator [Mariprofundaceae bacterium]|nr:Fur family transcriptional regulator [Mariprofundaceae bacterium]
MPIRLTSQRTAILTIINGSSAHWDAESVLQALQQSGQRIGVATVYRTLAVLEEATLIGSVFINERKCYERIDKQQHDHLLCSQCGCIEEFCHPYIAVLQSEMAQAHGFVAHNHSLIIRGLCRDCQS